ncbi:MAG: hypothetical protein LBI48_12080 [Burkholderiaceae bacterium]|jgi:hypothetical protein|nr:hypothetical protein [Burkholderiaceae bacterium]
MKVMKKVWSLLKGFLVAVSVTAAFSSTAQAAYDSTTFQDALNAGGTVVLDADLTGNFAVPAGVTVTLDLNGYKLDSITSNSSTLTNYGILTIKDSSGTNAGTITTSANMAAVMNYGTLAIHGGTFTRSLTSISWYVVRNGDGPGSSALITVIDGGVFKENVSVGDCSLGKASLFDNYGKIELIAGGTFSSPYTVMKVEETASIDSITGGTFTATGNGPCNTAINVWGDVTISGGTFTSVNGRAVDQGSWDDSSHSYSSSLTISGGTFKGGSNSLYLHMGTPNADTGTIATNITGGSFDGAITEVPSTTGIMDLSLSGGQFTDPAAADYLPPGYILKPSGNGYVVQRAMPAATAVPTAGHGALAILGLLLAGLGFLTLRRNRAS